MLNSEATDWGAEAQKRLQQIAACSRGGPGVTRLPFTAEHRCATDHISDWMRKAGMEVHLDAAGTLIGRHGGPATAPAMLIGSHQDSVINGGRYDGIMGIALACLAVERLASEGVTLPFPVEVLAFADEEGVRFPTALVGPRALAGTFDPAVLNLADGDGVTLHQAMTDFGLEVSAIPALARDPKATLGYLELHIEQGPVLEHGNHPVGVVTGICGIERNTITLCGETGHAGTVPMNARQDALVAASRFIAAVHDAALQTDELRATIGTLSLTPNVVNAIPDEVRLTLEVRAPDDRTRSTFAQDMRHIGEQIAAVADVGFSMDQTYLQPAVPCSAELTDLLAKAAAQVTGEAPHLPSGATHDASAMADLGPIAMLFLRCRDGVSHRPEEYASAADMGVAVAVVARFLGNL